MKLTNDQRLALAKLFLPTNDAGDYLFALSSENGESEHFICVSDGHWVDQSHSPDSLDNALIAKAKFVRDNLSTLLGRERKPKSTG